MAPKDILFHSRHVCLEGFQICPILFFWTVSIFPSNLILIYLVLLLFEKVIPVMYQYDFTISVGCWYYSRFIIIITQNAKSLATNLFH
jgi:hypothetical protein